jgi:hypothetical protein
MIFSQGGGGGCQHPVAMYAQWAHKHIKAGSMKSRLVALKPVQNVTTFQKVARSAKLDDGPLCTTFWPKV